MIIDKGVSVGEVVTFKIVSGAEILAKLIEETPNSYKVSKPMVIQVTNQGIGMMPYIITVNHEKPVDLFKLNIASVSPTEKEFADSYVQGTTGIALA